MEKCRFWLETLIRVLFVILILGIGIINLLKLHIDNSDVFFYSFLLLIFTLTIMWLYKRKFINKKIFFTIIFLYFLTGIGIRIYFIENLNFNLASDFDFVFQNARMIMNGTLATADNYYLSFNGYSFILSWLISFLFRIFGESVNVVLYANLVCQVLGVYFLYKIIALKSKKETAAILSATFFLLPTIIFANLLVATETPFLLIFLITVYYFYKIVDKKEYKPINFILFIIFGILMCFCNYIRPVMTVFIIALIIYYVLNMKHIKEIIFLIIAIFTYAICNTGINEIIENNIGTETRSGALGWSIYFGSNYDYCGAWSPEDSEYVFEVLKDETKGDSDLIILSLERLVDYGIIKTADLMLCKYESLWSNNVGTFGFVNDIVNKETSNIDFAKFGLPFEDISRIMVVLMCAGSAIVIIWEQKNRKDKWLFIELFGLGYILSNLLICLNGRYNIPLYPILIICCAPLVDKILIPKPKNVSVQKLTKIKGKEKILLIVPAYNEEASIEKTVNNIINNGYDYIIINDGSNDNTLEICQKNNYNYISLSSNLGIGGAVQTGYKYALENDYDIAIQFDADGQHDVKYIPSIVEPIKKGQAHFVIGSRFIDDKTSDFKSTKLRRLGINMISALIKWYSGHKIYDTTSGFRAANIDVIKRFNESYPTEYPEPISSFELLQEGYTIEEVPVKMHERQGGKSSIGSWKKVYYMINVCLSLIIVKIRGGK